MTLPSNLEKLKRLASPPGAKGAGEPAAHSSRATKTKETITLLSTALPIIGAVGTLFVWLAANFYVGTVDIQPANTYQKIAIDVFDQKGQPYSFHTPHFQLMPGKYHLAVTTDSNAAHHFDTQIELGKTSVIKVDDLDSAAAPAGQAVTRKHWWQIWKKSK